MTATPMMRQWSEIKRTMPGCLVLFRLGDFYEAFEEDAATLSSVCGVTLTSRPVAKGQRTPMAGVPHHAVDNYIAQLVRHGVKVAIVEQTGGDGALDKRSRMSGLPADVSPPSRPTEAPKSDGLAQPSPLDERRNPVSPGSEPPRQVLTQATPGLMGREVVRVVTSGTLVESDLIDRRQGNYLAAVAIGSTSVGFAYADITTGEFQTTEVSGPHRGAQLLDELARVRPAELVLAGPLSELLSFLGLDDAGWAALGLASSAETFPRWHFDASNAARRLGEHFGVASLAAFGCADLAQATAAAGAVLDYALETQRGRSLPLAGLATYSAGEFMALNAATRRNLELVNPLRQDGSGRASNRPTLIGVVDLTETPMGGRTLRRWLDQPLLRLDALAARHDAVEFLVLHPELRLDLRALLHGMADLERLANRAVSGYTGPRELLNLAGALDLVGAVNDRLASAEPLPAHLQEMLGDIAGGQLGVLAKSIHAAISPETPATLGVAGIIRRGHSAELDAIHDSVADARRWIAGLEAAERERTGLKKLKVGYNKVFGYYLEVSRAAADQVPAEYQRRQTLVDGERYITPELKSREEELQGAEERILDLERRLFGDLLARVVAEREAVLAAARDVGRLDTLAALAEVAVRDRWVRPVLDAGREIIVRAGRHPVIERMRPHEPFVPNDLSLDEGDIVLLTGPNMAGKSTVGRQLALIVVLAQMGSFVPAASARIGFVDRLFTRIGAQDDLAAGQSTFMVEMIETAHILHHATPQSLVILDELGRGTSTYDGMAIAWAVLEYLHNHPRLGPRTVFATHYHELTRLADELPRLKNFNMAVAETPEGIAFLHHIEPGAADRSYGIHVGELAGLPRPVLDRAWQVLGQLEAEGGVPLQAAHRPASTLGPGQLALFTPLAPEHPVLAALRALDANQLTPLQALQQLAELAEEARR